MISPGDVFGRLTVVALVERVRYDACTKLKWLCMCECGNSTRVLGAQLTKGGTRSCGCLRREVAGSMSASRSKPSAEEHIARFLSYTIRRGDCLLWTASRYKNDGYPRFAVGGRWVRAARWLYQQIHGPLPFDIVVRHTCDDIGCVDWTHLTDGTVADNVNDMLSRGRGRNQFCGPYGRAA